MEVGGDISFESKGGWNNFDVLKRRLLKVLEAIWT